MKRPFIIGWAIFATALAALLGWAGVLSQTRLAASNDEIPVCEVKRGDLDLRVPATGEIRASHSTMLTAPAVGGGALQITQLLTTRGLVKKGDIVIEFDPSEQRFKLEQNRSELLQAEQEITKANANAAVLAAQDNVALLKAHYGVRQAELDVQKNEIVSTIDATKNQLALQQANRVQAKLEKDVESHNASGRASIYLAQEKRNKAKLAMSQAQQNIDKMHVAAPMDGLISIQRNMNAAGGFFFSGMSLPAYHAGDQAPPGSAIAQVVDPRGLELTSKISERSHSNINVGQPVEVEFDALHGKIFHGTVKSVGGMSTRQFFEGDAGGSFDVSIQLSDADERLRSGFTAKILFIGDLKKNVLYIPRQALFRKDGKRIVYVKRGSGFDQREVKIQNESESRAVIEGLDAGTQVALLDPTAPRKPGNGGGSSPASLGGTP